MSNKLNCKVCGSENLIWFCLPRNLGGAVDGRIRMNEVGVTFYLGCEECSETLKTVDGDKIAEILTSIDLDKHL